MDGEGSSKGRKRSRTQDIVVTVLRDDAWDGRKGFTIAWKAAGWAHWQLRSERVISLEEKEGSNGMETDYVCYETFGGIVSSFVWLFARYDLMARFLDYAKDLTEFCEGKPLRACSKETLKG